MIIHDFIFIIKCWMIWNIWQRSKNRINHFLRWKGEGFDLAGFIFIEFKSSTSQLNSPRFYFLQRSVSGTCKGERELWFSSRLGIQARLCWRYEFQACGLQTEKKKKISISTRRRYRKTKWAQVTAPEAENQLVMKQSWIGASISCSLGLSELDRSSCPTPQNTPARLTLQTPKNTNNMNTKPCHDSLDATLRN